MHCEIGGTQGPLGYVSALGATRLVHWLILVAPSCLRSHNAQYIMLKSLIHMLAKGAPNVPPTSTEWINWNANFCWFCSTKYKKVGNAFMFVLDKTFTNFCQLNLLIAMEIVVQDM